MKNIKISIPFICILLLLTILCQLPTALAQGPGFDEDVEDTPVDGGVTLIAAAAIGYGVKKMADKRTRDK